MNRVELIGRLTREPEIMSSAKNVVARFTLAVQRSYQNKDGEYDADFISCVAFGKTAEFIESHLCDKGLRVAIAGHIQTGSYETKDGDKRYTTDVIIDSVYPIDWSESEKKRSSNKNNRR